MPLWRSTRRSKVPNSASPIPRWVTIAGILGGLALGLLGVITAYIDKQDQEMTRQREEAAATHKKLRDIGPVILISQEAAPTDPAELANIIATLDELIAKRPNDAGPLAAKGTVSLKIGNDEAAAKLTQEALDIDPELPNALNTMALVNARAGNIEEARLSMFPAKRSISRPTTLAARVIVFSIPSRERTVARMLH